LRSCSWPAIASLTFLAAATLVGCSGAAPAEDVDPGTVVATSTGSVRGLAQDGVSSWEGVPYAAPPVGDLRWQAPQPVEPWSGVREARDFGPACVQGTPTALSEALIKVEDTSEDCLTLNVHRPTGSERPLPVMVWIHGGAFSYGSGSQPVYNSPELVKRGIVLVTLNYRLGRLGFLAHPALQEDAGRVANFGLLDQAAALTWVRDNIAGFGGDPANVTVFGESAGGVSVNALMSAPLGAGLFDRAVAQSGLGREPSMTWDRAVEDAAAGLEPVVGGAASAAGLRALDAEQVMSLPVNVLAGQAPILDDVFPRPVAAAFEAGVEADVPYLTGTTDLELPDVVFERLGSDPDQLRADALGDRRAEAVAAYGSDGELDLHLLSDAVFTEPARHLALEHADDAATFRYRFTIAPEPVLAELGGAPHASELPFVFDDTERQGYPVDGADDLALAIADLWVDFATDGEPDGWPEAGTDELMTFGTGGPTVAADPWTARLDVVEAASSPP
jgi:para-nitrobenzyl esterase